MVPPNVLDDGITFYFSNMKAISQMMPRRSIICNFYCARSASPKKISSLGLFDFEVPLTRFCRDDLTVKISFLLSDTRAVSTANKVMNKAISNIHKL